MTIRPALYTDCAAIYAITSEPSVREASTRSEAFDYTAHMVWWDRRYSDPGQKFYVAENGEGIVGYVRYGRAGLDAEIAIAVASQHRGHGYGLTMLKETEAQAAKELGASRLVALVLVGNAASSLMFARAGYKMKGWQERFRKMHQRWERVV